MFGVWKHHWRLWFINDQLRSQTSKWYYDMDGNDNEFIREITCWDKSALLHQIAGCSVVIHTERRIKAMLLMGFAWTNPGLTQYTISLSSLCKLIWGHWTYETPVRYILSSVWVRLSIFSHLSIIQYMGLCGFSFPISLVMIERIYTLSYYHHQIGSMNYYPLFRVRSLNNGMRCMSLYILTARFKLGIVVFCVVNSLPHTRPVMRKSIW